MRSCPPCPTSWPWSNASMIAVGVASFRNCCCQGPMAAWMSVLVFWFCPPPKNPPITLLQLLAEAHPERPEARQPSVSLDLVPRALLVQEGHHHMTAPAKCPILRDAQALLHVEVVRVLTPRQHCNLPTKKVMFKHGCDETTAWQEV